MNEGTNEGSKFPSFLLWKEGIREGRNEGTKKGSKFPSFLFWRKEGRKE